MGIDLIELYDLITAKGIDSVAPLLAILQNREKWVIILLELYHRYVMNKKEIAKLLRTDTRSIDRAIRYLEQEGLVQMKKLSKNHVIMITERGRHAIIRLREALRTILKEKYSSPEKIASMKHRTVVDYLGERVINWGRFIGDLERILPNIARYPRLMTIIGVTRKPIHDRSGRIVKYVYVLD